MKEHLRLISAFHYVMGGLQIFICSFPLFHVLAGLFLLVAPAHIFDVRGDEIIPLRIFGGFFMVIGGIFVLAGWTLGLCTIWSGRYIALRRKRTFSIVMGAINCMHFPFGTALGVFTLILLTKDEAKVLYGEPIDPPLVLPVPSPPAAPPAFAPSTPPSDLSR
jgi:hypothetical protein